MAKGKKAAALFEVIHLAKKQAEKTPSGGLATPKWWFKGRGATAPVEHPAPPEPVEPIRSSVVANPYIPPVELVAAKLSDDDDAPESAAETHEPDDSEESVVESTVDEPAESSDETTEPEAPQPAYVEPKRVEPKLKPAKLSIFTRRTEPREEIGAPPSTPRWKQIGFDAGRQLVNFKLSYTSAGIAAFGVAVVVLLAFIIGRQFSGGPQRAGASPTIDQLRAGASFPDVLNVTPTPSDREGDAEQPTNGSASVAQPQNKTTTSAAGEKVQRIVGMQYVVVQSYPDEEDAKQAADALTKNGIRCTVERGLPGWGSSWYSVVGATGFQRIRNSPEYDSYLKAIQDVNKQFAGNSKFKKFNPMPVGWKDQRNQ